MGAPTYLPTQERLVVSYSQRLVDHIDQLLTLPELSPNETRTLRQLQSQRECTVDELKLVTSLNKKASSDLSLQHLLSDATGVVLPKLEEPQASEALIKRRAFLRAKHEAEEYERMVKDVDMELRGRGAVTVKETADEYKKALTTAINVISLVFAMFFVGYYLAHVNGYAKTTALICGLVLGIIMLFVELLLFIIRASR